ncbi:MAG TPA: trigger factor [Kiritimatiellia bacterium]|jgi:trigger factor|nr:trigger factor [Kiritimatiellia bacterium]HOM59402.1 trigger factor [Kiritimatiellia bacterium]HPC49440.1 trigger factor [Kiritimatiellia bacterium]HPK36959.1 trigger factor [Kiritimatiellia bacterium]HRU19630.1 trigger factor [Kiritimatiellia bacterium]
MKVESKSVGPCQVKVFVKAEAEETRGEYEKVLKLFMKEGRVPGFRQGKVPREVIKRSFHNEIQEEVRSRLFRSLYKPALEQKKIAFVALRDVGDMLFSPETGISFSMTVDVKPEFELPRYKKIPVVFEEPVVTEEQVDGQIQQLREAFAQFKEAGADDEIRDGDMVRIDFAGTVDGQSLAELDPAAKALAGESGQWVLVQEGRFLPEILQALRGLKQGAETTAQVTFGADHPITALQGKTATYSVTVREIRARSLPADEELCGRLKVASIDEMRTQTREGMMEAARKSERIRREQTVIDFLLKQADFDLPESEEAEEINTILDQMMGEAQSRGLTREDLEKSRGQIIENATTTARRQLRLRYILARIAEKEALTLSPEEIDSRIAEFANASRSTPAQFRAQVEKNGRMDALREHMLNLKTIQFLLDQAKG